MINRGAARVPSVLARAPRTRAWGLRGVQGVWGARAATSATHARRADPRSMREANGAMYRLKQGGAKNDGPDPEDAKEGAKEEGKEGKEEGKEGKEEGKDEATETDGAQSPAAPLGTPGPSGASGGGGGGGSSPDAPTPKLFPPLLAIPMRDRPPVPGTVFAINVDDPEVIRAIDLMIEHKHPHFVLFHAKDTEVNSDVITDRALVYDVGVHCVLSKITRPEERKADQSALIVAYAQLRCRLEELTTPERRRAAGAAQAAGDVSGVAEDAPTRYLSAFRVLYATTRWLSHEPYDKHSQAIVQVMNDIKRTTMALTANNEVARDQLIRADKFDPHDFADYVALLLMASAQQIQAILEALNVQERLEMVLDLIQIEDDLKRVKNKTTENMRRALFENQNKAFFREFINQFKQVAGLNEKGAGGGEGGGGDKISRYLAKAKALHFTAEAQEAFDYELDKLRGQHENSSESYVIEKYLDWLVSVPWGIYLHDLFNLRKAKRTLEQDHYGLEDVKQRILEFISMGRILGNVDGKILCLVGPPGTGKTLIAKLIAESLNRKYVRIAMGGVQDMHELKGHRRTYVGAVPGRIILALKQAKTLNPLMLIDEIDKLDTTLRSGGGALLAFLEILDPEQNHSFIDNYLDVKVDLSKVLFVCTANYLGNIPPPLRDRMEVIEVSGYTTNEKVEITKRHLIPQAARKAGLEGGKVEIPDRTIVRLIERYCRESGLRNVKKQIGRIFSKAAFKIVEEIEKTDEAEAKASTVADAEAKATASTVADAEATTEGNGKAKPEAEATEAADATAAEAIDKAKPEGEAEVTDAAPAADETASGPPSVGAGPKKRKKKDASASLSADIAAKREALEKDLEIAPEEEGPPPPLVIPDSVKIVVTPEVLKDYIGPEIYPKDRVYETLPAGVATGLSYSGLGNGDALYIESILTNSIGSGTGHAGVRVTGSLKDVMKELASISYSFAKLFMTKRFPKNRFFEAADIHVHCPDGAIPKDGPSAGISFTTSLVSLALNQPIAGNIAMTGELTVTGRVLAVGGLREKILGAKRYGCDTIIFPRDIENTLEDIPAEVKDGVKLIAVEWYHEVFDLVFPGVGLDQGNRVWEEEFSALDTRRKKEKK